MTELREKVFETLCEHLSSGDLILGLEEATNAILDIPEIADALRLKPIKPLNLGHSIGVKRGQ